MVDLDTLRDRIKGTNIDERTLLATDYLNHFNEIVMLVELVPDMPELFSEAREWQPKSYQDHFRDSTFTEKELAITAYDHVHPKYREPFEDTIGEMDRLVGASLAEIEVAIADGGEDRLRDLASTASRRLQKLIDVASAIIHGGAATMEQTDIDRLLEADA
jgi:hypothetical protein